MKADRKPLRGLKSATEPSTEDSPHPEDQRIGWAAGFLDGEGCIHIIRQRYRSSRSDTFALRVCITQNDRRTLEHFCNAAGIQAPIYEVPRAANHRRQCYTLNYSGANAMQLITLLSPHLRRKRLEAAAALRFWTRGQMGVRRGGKGLDPDLTTTRERYFRLLKRLK